MDELINVWNQGAKLKFKVLVTLACIFSANIALADITTYRCEFPDRKQSFGIPEVFYFEISDGTNVVRIVDEISYSENEMITTTAFISKGRNEIIYKWRVDSVEVSKFSKRTPRFATWRGDETNLHYRAKFNSKKRKLDLYVRPMANYIEYHKIGNCRAIEMNIQKVASKY